MPALPTSVTVLGLRLPRREDREEYLASAGSHAALTVHVPVGGRYWHGEAVIYMARGTRGELRVRTVGTYSDPRRAADALTRLLHRWCVADYLARAK
jgi:hypothetical protein